MMKKIAAACALALASFALLGAQAQVPGFSNTVHAAVGQSVEKNAQIKFLGFTEYFTGNVTVGKITFAGDIAWQLIPGPGGLETRFDDHNVNVVINPVKGLDIGLGTNLNWTVGPGPSSGPKWSAYSKAYYGGINLENAQTPVSPDPNYPRKGFEVINYYAKKAFGIRYRYQNIFEAGFSLPELTSSNNFNAGIGLKANIRDKFSIGFAYNGPFNRGKNYIYVGASTSALKNFNFGVYWNMLTDTRATAHDGANTVGTVIDFTVKNFLRIRPEGAVTFWSDPSWAPAAYLAVRVASDFTKELTGGLNASWGLGSDLKDDPNNVKAGARFDINPYILWTINKTHILSFGAQLTPVLWRDKTYTFGWQIPIAWKVYF